MEITYLVEGVEYKTECTDDYIRIDDQKKSGRRKVVVTACCDLELRDAQIVLPHSYHLDDLVMANGYQSWTRTREFFLGEYSNDLSKLPKMVVDKYHLRAFGSQAFWKEPSGGHLGFDFSWISGKEPFFIGSDNYKNAYLLIYFEEKFDRIRLQSDIEGKVLKEGESFVVFDYMIEASPHEYFSRFRPRTSTKLFGYTSWYNHYQNINESILNEALDAADPRFDLFQIDDGYESFVGDWLDVDPVKFPQGLSPILEKIHAKNLKAGIWLAPFVAEEESKLVKEHPDWIAKDAKGTRISAGYVWSGSCVLDLNHPEVVEYIRNALSHYVTMGFDFFKLDFLYAVNLKPLTGKTRSETSEFAYRLLRDTLGDKLILGCGATLSNAFSRFDYCRIGPDVSLTFDDIPHMRILHPERVSTKNTILNTIYRSPLDGKVFLNDPDVFMLRDDNNKMSFTRRSALTRLNALFGSLFLTSDLVGRYNEKQKKILEEALVLFKLGNPLGYALKDERVEIRYEIEGEVKYFYYDSERGSLRDKRSILPPPGKPILPRMKERA